MSRLAGLVGSHRLDATAAWAATVLLLGAAVRFIVAGDPDWAGFGLVVVVVTLVPPAVTRDPTITLPGELVALAAVPVLIRATGAFPQATPFLAAAGLALLAAIVVESYTSLEMTPRFTVVFTVITTMAFGGAWTIGLWVADRLLSTGFLGGQDELMWDLVTATGMGIVAGVVFEVYFERTDRLRRLHGRAARDRRRIGRAADRIDALDGEPRTRLAVQGMQTVLAGIAAYAVVRSNWGLVVNSAVPLAITFLPGLLRREYGYPMDVRLVLWVTVAATLHAIGAIGPYQAFDWYDSVTHTVSATLVAGVGYAVARAAELHTKDVSFDPTFRGAFVLLFVLAVGVWWEILEFGTGGIAAAIGGEPVLAQYGADDIAKDLAFDAVGGVVVILLGSDRFDVMARAVTHRVGLLVRRE